MGMIATTFLLVILTKLSFPLRVFQFLASVLCDESNKIGL